LRGQEPHGPDKEIGALGFFDTSEITENQRFSCNTGFARIQRFWLRDGVPDYRAAIFRNVREKTGLQMAFQNVAANAGDSIHRALAAPVQTGEGPAFFAPAIADMPFVKQGAIGAHAGEIMQGVHKRNTASANHRPDQRRQFREGMGIDHIRAKILNDARQPLHQPGIDLDGDLVIFAFPFCLSLPIPNEKGRRMSKPMNGETVSQFCGLALPGNGGNRDCMSFPGQTPGKVFDEYLRASHTVGRKQ